MDFKFEKIGEILLVGVFGELDHHNAAALREETDSKITSGGVRFLVIDFSGLELMDSSGIGFIMGRYRLIASVGGKLCVSGASASIRKVIELSGLENLIILCDSAREAVKILKGGK